MDYSRQAFRGWLEGLPQDEPFCGPVSCPIANWLSTTNAKAFRFDRALAVAIDDYDVAKHYDDSTWNSMTPRKVIALIDELETA